MTVWRIHDKGSTVWSGDWISSLSIYGPAVVIAAAVLGASLFLSKATRPTNETPLQGKPAWRKLQWANAELERLKKENINLQHELAKAGAVATELGTAAASDANWHKLFQENKKLADDRLEELSKLKNAKQQLDSEVTILQKELEDVRSKDGTTPRSRAIAFCGKLRKFIASQEPRPMLMRLPSESGADFDTRKIRETLAWRRTIGAKFRMEIMIEAQHVRDEIQIRVKDSNFDLDAAIEEAGKSCDVEKLEAIHGMFWNLVGTLNE
jgi:hypothetical protein